MYIFATFFISLALIVFSLTMKSWELSRGQKIFLASSFAKADIWILKTVIKVRLWWSHINFKNTKLIFSWIVVKMKESIIAVKRRFDHRQSHFFTKREPVNSKSKSSASFFLRHVSDYKKSLREGNKDQ